MKHGSRATYWRHGCRCDLCKRAEKIYQGAYRSPRHGLSGYMTGCRCEICKAAKAAYAKAYRQQRKEKGLEVA